MFGFFGHLAIGFVMFVLLCSFFHSVTLMNTMLIFLWSFPLIWKTVILISISQVVTFTIFKKSCWISSTRQVKAQSGICPCPVQHSAEGEKQDTASLGENWEPGRQAWGEGRTWLWERRVEPGKPGRMFKWAGGSWRNLPLHRQLVFSSWILLRMGFILVYIWVRNPSSLVMPETPVVPAVSHARMGSPHLLAKWAWANHVGFLLNEMIIAPKS